MVYSHQLYMIWLVGVLVKSYTYRAHLENASRAHAIICYNRYGAGMHLFYDLTARTHRALELKELRQLHQKRNSMKAFQNLHSHLGIVCKCLLAYPSAHPQTCVF